MKKRGADRFVSLVIRELKNKNSQDNSRVKHLQNYLLKPDLLSSPGLRNTLKKGIKEVPELSDLLYLFDQNQCVTDTNSAIKEQPPAMKADTQKKVNNAMDEKTEQRPVHETLSPDNRPINTASPKNSKPVPAAITVSSIDLDKTKLQSIEDLSVRFIGCEHKVSEKEKSEFLTKSSKYFNLSEKWLKLVLKLASDKYKLYSETHGDNDKKKKIIFCQAIAAAFLNLTFNCSNAVNDENHMNTFYKAIDNSSRVEELLSSFDGKVESITQKNRDYSAVYDPRKKLFYEESRDLSELTGDKNLPYKCSKVIILAKKFEDDDFVPSHILSRIFFWLCSWVSDAWICDTKDLLKQATNIDKAVGSFNCVERFAESQLSSKNTSQDMPEDNSSQGIPCDDPIFSNWNATMGKLITNNSLPDMPKDDSSQGIPCDNLIFSKWNTEMEKSITNNSLPDMPEDDSSQGIPCTYSLFHSPTSSYAWTSKSDQLSDSLPSQFETVIL